jgi:GT2 family glycosyltransferase
MNYLLTIIIVNYNTGDLLSQCITSIQNHTACGSYEIIVVDNASTDVSCKIAQSLFPTVKFILNAHNRGFAAANNQGITASQADYILLLNPDTIVTPQALDTMLAFMEQRPEAAVLGCKLVYPDGSLQFSCSNNFLSLGFVCWRILIRAFFLDRWIDRLIPDLHYPGRLKLTLSEHEQVQSVEHLVGAVLMVRRTVIDQVGLLDENYFLYLEETDWCYRIRQAQLLIYYTPDAKIIHLEGMSSKPSAYLYYNEREVNILRGKLRFMMKHRPSWEYKSYQFLLVIIIIVKLIGETIRRISIHKPNREEFSNKIKGRGRVIQQVLSRL